MFVIDLIFFSVYIGLIYNSLPLKKPFCVCYNLHVLAYKEQPALSKHSDPEDRMAGNKMLFVSRIGEDRQMVQMTVFASILLAAYLFLVFFGAKPGFRANRVERDYLSKDNMVALRGAMATQGILHHISQAAGFGKLSGIYGSYGYLAVGVFFFLSGYGLMTQHMSKPNYHKGFLFKRLSSILIPYILAALLFIAAGFITGKPYTVSEIFSPYIKRSTFIPYAWYISVMVGFYIVFYVLMLICKKRYRLIVVLGFVTAAAWIVTAYHFKYGAWWYNTVVLLPIGMLWALNFESIRRWASRSYDSCFMVLPLFALSLYIREHVKNIPYHVATGCCAALFTLLVIFLLMKLRLGNRAVNFLGKISLEIYLVQGLYIIVMHPYIKNKIVFCITALALSIATGAALNYIDAAIIKKLNKLVLPAPAAAKEAPQKETPRKAANESGKKKRKKKSRAK